MGIKRKLFGVITALAMAVSAVPSLVTTDYQVFAAEDVSDTMYWNTVEIGGGGFVSGIVTGQKEMYLRTDVGGAYKYDYEKGEWVQLMTDINDNDRGFLSVSGIAIDPTDDNTVYFLCGCAYFSGARTEIFKTTDGGKTFERYDVTDLIQVHGNGDGRECCEPIAVDPDNPDIIYAGGDVTAGDSALIKSTDGGKTWKAVKGYADEVKYPYTILWPFWTDHAVKAITTDGEQSYPQQNGVATIKILDGKVYVGTSVTGQANVHVADVDKDEFTVLSEDLPTANYPVTISDDGNGNLFVTYIAGLAFGGNAGGAFKYNIATGKVTDISPVDKAIGMVTADKTDPNKLVARTCGVWSDQWFEEEWTDDSIAWGDHFYRSTDGGATWTDITPGQQVGQYTDNHYFLSNPIDTNGYDWIYGKACHWGSGILIDPRNPDKILLTSGNGVFACDNTWAEKGVQFYFDPSGVEEVVALDMVSAPGGPVYSAIGDYDGFVHVDPDEIPLQHKPNMGSTSTIGCCSANPKVLVRGGKDTSKGYYTTDGGTTWTEMKGSVGGGDLFRCDIAKLDDDTYRVFSTNASGITYTDDWGETWTKCTGTVGTNPFGVLVDKEDNNIVYAYTAKYNSYWASDTTKKEPTLDDAQYDFMVSTDGGKTFTNNIVCKYDMCDVANRIAYLEEGKVALAAGWNGLYIGTKDGKTEKLDSVSYCKTVGYGAPEKAGDPNTLFIYGKPQDSDPEGIYRSTDSGKTWVLINQHKLFGGTGNGNFLVGDMNEFGKVYMSTVGCGIVYGEISDGKTPETPTSPPTTKPVTTAPVTKPVTTAPVTSTIPVTSTAAPATTTDSAATTAPATTAGPTNPPVTVPIGAATKYGDVNLDKLVDIADVVALNMYLINSADYDLSEESRANADCFKDGILTMDDSTAILNYCAQLTDYEELGK